MPLPSGGAVTALAVTERALIRPLRGHLPQRGRLLCLTNALKAAIMNRLTGCGEAWYRAWFGSKRPRVRIPTLRPQKASAAAGAFFIPSTLRLRMRLHAYTLYTRIFGSVPNENDSLRRFCPPNWNLASQNLPPKGNVINLSTEVPSTTVIARSAATWQSVFSLVTGAKSGRCKGNGLPRQCAHWLAMTS